MRASFSVGHGWGRAFALVGPVSDTLPGPGSWCPEPLSDLPFHLLPSQICAELLGKEEGGHLEEGALPLLAEAAGVCQVPMPQWAVGVPAQGSY